MSDLARSNTDIISIDVALNAISLVVCVMLDSLNVLGVAIYGILPHFSPHL